MDWFMDEEEAHKEYRKTVKELKREIKEKEMKLNEVVQYSDEYHEIEDDIYRLGLQLEEFEGHLKNKTKREGPRNWDPNVLY